MIFLTIFVLVLTYFVTNFIKERKRISTFLSKFPSPSRHVLLGNTKHFIGKDPSEIFKTIMSFHHLYGKNIAQWKIFNDYGLIIGDPKDLETIFCSSKLTQKAIGYTFIEAWIGTGLLTSSGKKWFTRRKIITPTFHFNILEQFIEVFDRQTDVMVEKLRPYSGKGDFNIYNYSTLCALDVISEASMGIKINAQDLPDSEYVKAVKAMSLIVFERSFSKIRQWPWMFKFTALAKEQEKQLKILHKFTDDVILQRKEKLEQKLNNTADDAEKNKKMNFLDMLLLSHVEGKPLSNSDIREEVDTFMFEGHDTTTSGISFTFYHLSQNKEVQQKVFEEVREVFGDDPTSGVTHRQLQDLKYLEMVIKESMRIHPPVPIIGRRLTEDTTISGVTIPQGTNILIPIFAVHHDANVYPDPEKFDPERFSPDAMTGRNPYSYIPFSAGARNCIGQKFAMLEVKTIVSKMIRHYELVRSDKKIKLQADLILKTVDGVFIKIKPRIYS